MYPRMFPGQRIVGDGDAAARCDLANAGADILFTIKDHVVAAEPSCEIGLLQRAHRANNARAKRLGPLDQDRPDATSRRMNQDRLARAASIAEGRGDGDSAVKPERMIPMNSPAKLTDTQFAILSEASQRKDRCLIPPKTLKGGAAQKLAAKLLKAAGLKCRILSTRVSPSLAGE